MIQIKHRLTGKILYESEKDADLRYADLTDANLTDADLRYANLRCADLTDADLRYADLRDVKGTFIFNYGVKLKIVQGDDDS